MQLLWYQQFLTLWMYDDMSEKKSEAIILSLPFKNLAGALLFCVFLGPVGLLYASTWGGILMIMLGFIVISAKLIVPIMMVWIGSCIWGVIATNRYNQKIASGLNIKQQ